MHWIAPAARDAADELRANSGLTSAQYGQPVLGLKTGKALDQPPPELW